MERIERLKLRAEERKRVTDLEIARLEVAKELNGFDKRNHRDIPVLKYGKKTRKKKKAQRLYELGLKKRQRQQDLKNIADTPEARTRESFRHTKEIRDRDISRGLTKEQRDYKYMDWKMRRDCDNAIAQGECKDIRDFLKRS
ncbi:hypothetical protein ES708_01388 [subsurface metagenome]